MTTKLYYWPLSWAAFPKSIGGSGLQSTYAYNTFGKHSPGQFLLHIAVIVLCLSLYRSTVSVFSNNEINLA